MDKPTPSLLPPIHPSAGQTPLAADRVATASSHSTATRRIPTARFMWSHPAHMLALGFGSGLSPFAPGTVGTLWAWVAFLVWRALNPAASLMTEAVILGVALLASVWASERTARHMGVADPSPVVIDEIVAFWLVLWLVCPEGRPDNMALQTAAFVLFRFFDAVKPPPVCWADQAFKGPGWRGAFGIVFDDLVAAFCTLLVIALWVR